MPGRAGTTGPATAFNYSLMPRRPPSRSILSPASRRVVAALLIAAGILLIIGQLLRLYVLAVNWRVLGMLPAGPLLGVLLGVGAGGLMSYAGWRVGIAGEEPRP